VNIFVIKVLGIFWVDDFSYSSDSFSLYLNQIENIKKSVKINQHTIKY